MKEILHLADDLLFNEGATRRCYYHPSSGNKCLKITKGSAPTNEHDLKTYHTVKAILEPYIAVYDGQLVNTNRGKALVCELIRDNDGETSQSFADYKLSHKIDQQLASQFIEFFGLLQKHRLFFFDFNPKNFMVQKTKTGVRLKYTDLKSFGKTKTAVSLEKIPYFAMLKLKRRTNRFIGKYLSSAE